MVGTSGGALCRRMPLVRRWLFIRAAVVVHLLLLLRVLAAVLGVQLLLCLLI